MFSLDLLIVLAIGALFLGFELRKKAKIARRKKWYFEKYLPKKYGTGLTGGK